MALSYLKHVSCKVCLPAIFETKLYGLLQLLIFWYFYINVLILGFRTKSRETTVNMATFYGPQIYF